jgi:hypothetical protein
MATSIEELREIVARNAISIAELTESQKETRALMTESQKKSDERQKKSDERLDRLELLQEKTESLSGVSSPLA